MTLNTSKKHVRELNKLIHILHSNNSKFKFFQDYIYFFMQFEGEITLYKNNSHQI
jgi:hypothetical protein